jgi:hypothetical protein
MSGLDLSLRCNRPRRSTRWKVTHVDDHGRHRRTVLQAADNHTVAALAEAMYGEAMALSLVRLDRLDTLRSTRGGK